MDKGKDCEVEDPTTGNRRLGFAYMSKPASAEWTDESIRARNRGRVRSASLK